MFNITTITDHFDKPFFITFSIIISIFLIIIILLLTIKKKCCRKKHKLRFFKFDESSYQYYDDTNYVL